MSEEESKKAQGNTDEGCDTEVVKTADSVNADEICDNEPAKSADSVKSTRSDKADNTKGEDGSRKRKLEVESIATDKIELRLNALEKEIEDCFGETITNPPKKAKLESQPNYRTRKNLVDLSLKRY